MKSKSAARPKKITKAAKIPVASTNGSFAASDADVMTLAEAAAFLRVAPVEFEKSAVAGEVPGKLIGGEWRFLLSSLREWLGKPATPKKLSSKAAMLSIAGAWKDDETAEAMVEEIYRERKRHLVGGE